MSFPAVKSDSALKLNGLLDRVASAVGEALKSLIDTDVRCSEGQLRLTATDTWLQQHPGPFVLVSGSVGADDSDKLIHFLLDASTAATLSGHMLMAPKEAIDQRREEGSMSDEDLEAFGDVANVICSTAEAALRESVPEPMRLRLQEHRLLDPASPAESTLGEGTWLQYSFPIVISDSPEANINIFLDTETGELWNTRPIDTIDGPISHDGANEDIPEAPIRGTMATYIIDPDVMDVVRRSGRRTGLELERHSSSAIPNPSAHHDQFVLIDVTAGEERRFEWCKRLTKNSDIKTILIIHHPSKPRVLQGLAAKADAILGWPVREQDLSARLAKLLDGGGSPEDSDDDS